MHDAVVDAVLGVAWSHCSACRTGRRCWSRCRRSEPARTLRPRARTGRGSRALPRPPRRHRRPPSSDASRRNAGLRSSRPQAQVLRNQSCGSRCSGAGFRAVVGGLDDDADVVRRGLGVGDHDVEEPVLVEDTGVASSYSRSSRPRLAFSSRSRAYGILGLRIAVQPPHPRVSGRAVHGPPVLLDVLAVIAFAIRQTEQPLLQDGIAPVPQRDGEVEEAIPIADAAEAVLAPPVRAGVGLLEREISPGVTGRLSSPRGRCPTGVPRGTGPKSATVRSRLGTRRAGRAQRCEASPLDLRNRRHASRCRA